MSLGSSSNQNEIKKQQFLAQARLQAKHGDFFFAKWAASDGYVRSSPCFVLSDHPDPHNEIIILKCTTQPWRTSYDIPIACLRKPSIVRANKIYTIQRSQLEFPIAGRLSQTEYSAVMAMVQHAVCL